MSASGPSGPLVSIFEWPPKTGFTVGFMEHIGSVGRVLDWGWKGC